MNVSNSDFKTEDFIDNDFLFDSFSLDEIDIFNSFDLFDEQNINENIECIPLCSNDLQLDLKTDHSASNVNNFYDNIEIQKPNIPPLLTYENNIQLPSESKQLPKIETINISFEKKRKISKTISSSSESDNDSNISKEKIRKIIEHQATDDWPFLFSLNRLPQKGQIQLTEEEERTLKNEKLEIPTEFPLTKAQEKVLKRIRRKIKNKLSAQESRRKRKQYVDTLEKKSEFYINENNELKKKLIELEQNNKLLQVELQKMQYSVTQQQTSNFGTIIMITVLFFTVILGVWPVFFSKNRISGSTSSNSKDFKKTFDTVSEDDRICRLYKLSSTPSLKSSTKMLLDENDMSSFEELKSDDINSYPIITELCKIQNGDKLSRIKSLIPKNNTNIDSFVSPTKIKRVNVNKSTNEINSSSEYIIYDNNDEAKILIFNLPASNSAINITIPNTKERHGSLTKVKPKHQAITPVNLNNKRVIDSEMHALKYRFINLQQ